MGWVLPGIPAYLYVMKKTYVFWYRTKDNKEYLFAEIECIKPSRTKARKELDNILSFDEEVTEAGWVLKDDKYKAMYPYMKLLPHTSRK